MNPRYLHPFGFPPKTLSFWASYLVLSGLFVPNRKVRAITGFAGLLCGLGGAGMVYERVAERNGIPREPVAIIRNANSIEMQSLLAHLLFGAIGAYELFQKKS